jgi:hypothetical protein
MIQRIIFVISLFGVFSCIQKSTDTISLVDLHEYEDSAASFLKWLTINDTSTLFLRVLNENNPSSILCHKYLSNEFDAFDYSLTMLNQAYKINDSLLFTSIDTAIINELMKNKTNSQIIDTNLIGVTIINNGIISNTIKGKFSAYSQISLPLFAADFNIVLVEINKICLPECGYGIICVYKRTAIGWEKIEQKDTWIN